jgi:molybdopterin-guanine dinucleotide biosynthesis protein B
MNRIHIVGRKNHGKTTLIVELLHELRARGVRVGSIKHSSHIHELDTPGKDSHRHRQAGAEPASIVTPDSIGLFLPRPTTPVYDLLEPLYADCELVVVEGHIEAVGTKIEVWRAAMGTPCLATVHTDIRAVISDDQPPVSTPVWPRGDVTRIVDRIVVLCRSNSTTHDTLPWPAKKESP